MSPERPARPLVLVVDDDEILTRSLRRVLAHAGIDIVIERSVAGARARLAYEPVDLILTDFQLPDGHGVEIADLVRAVRPGLEVVLMSAAPDDAMAALGPRGVAVLAKPFAVPSLLVALSGALGPFWSRAER